MAISSVGIGSGIDANSIISQLGSIERQPLKSLQTKASTLQTQLSLYGKIKSQVSAIGDAAANLSLSSAWSAPKGTSSNSSAVGVTVATGALAASVSVEVANLARAQSSVSQAMSSTAPLSAGTLSFRLGTWNGAALTPAFTIVKEGGIDVKKVTPAKVVAVTATDTLSTLADKINAAGAGVTASVLQDGSQQRLMLRSSATGLASGFEVATSDPGLAQFKMTDGAATTAGAGGMYISQTALDANLKINGVDVTSTTNKITNALPGVTLTLGEVTTKPVELTIENDLDAVKAKMQTMVDAYNTLNTTLVDATKYDATTKRGAALQGDSMTLSLQTAMRSMLSSTSAGSTSYKTLSDAGIERQTDGSLKLNSSKINAALANMTELKKLFTTDNSNTATNGFALKIRDFSRGLVSFDGRVTNRSAGIQTSISKNSADQDRVNERADRVEASLRKQYSALDSKMSQMSGLSSYVSSQIAQWNKSS